jgi:putative spermidine/putrescine transport system permease protein
MGQVTPASIFSWAFTAVVLVFLILPSLIVIPISVNPGQFIQFPPTGFSWTWYRAFFTDPKWVQAALHTLIVSLGSAALATVLGTLASIGLVRGSFRGRSFVRGAFLVPLVMPTMILAIGLYQLFATLHLIGTLLGLILAYTVLGIPVVILAVTAGLQTVDEQLERSARSLGASPVRAFMDVTVPLIRTSIIGGAIFAFITAFDEVVIAIFIGGTTAITLPLQMWLGLRFELNPVIPAASTVVLVSAIVILLIAELVTGGRKHSPVAA